MDRARRNARRNVIRHIAAYAICISLSGCSRTVQSTAVDPRRWQSTESNRLETSDRMASLAPTDDRTWILLFHGASKLWRAGYSATAKPALELIIETRPELEIASYAAHLMVNTLIKRGDSEGLLSLVTSLEKDVALMTEHPNLHNRIRYIQRRSRGSRAGCKLRTPAEMAARIRTAP